MVFKPVGMTLQMKASSFTLISRWLGCRRVIRVLLNLVMISEIGRRGRGGLSEALNAKNNIMYLSFFCVPLGEMYQVITYDKCSFLTSMVGAWPIGIFLKSLEPTSPACPSAKMLDCLVCREKWL
jgi:hypothetical protein